jgi:AraC-like DNA-binding protein
MFSLQPMARENRMADLLAGLASQDGFTPTRIEGVQVLRSSWAQSRKPVVYAPSVVIVAQGQKVGYVGNAVHAYDRDHYLVLSVLIPFECAITQATPEAPFLALSVGVDTVVLNELVMDMEEADGDRPPMSAVSSSLMTRELRESALRLLRCLHSSQDSRILGRQMVREILYRILQGEQGAALRALSGLNSSFGQIARALKRIHSEYRTSLDVESLARTAGMSVSVFHQHFKTVTAFSPIQYLKSIRLHKARTLMAKAGFNAKAAADAVGYASTSQFSREFKRFFGASPVEEAARVRHLNLPK